MTSQTNQTQQVPAKEIAELMQPLLVDLIALSLNGKQAHWHLRGTTFTQVHEQLDELIDAARGYADDVAERVVALGVEVDGRPHTIADNTHVQDFVEGFVDVGKVVKATTERLDTVIGTARKALEPLGEMDQVSQDVVIELLRGLEKYRWMFWAQHH